MSGILSAICTNYAIASAFPSTVKVLVVGGGGAGGGDRGGGGGGGGVIYDSMYPISDNTLYTVKVGDGGIGQGAGHVANNGGNSVFHTLTAIGGGGGGVTGGGPFSPNSGGSGGGGGGGNGTSPGGATVIGGAGTVNQGYAGGNGYGGNDPTYITGGGGGAGAVGGNATSSSAGNGGIGVENSISGSPVYYAGGGGGSFDQRIGGVTEGIGGNGGGGAGGNVNNGVNGTANTGGGGGGAYGYGSGTIGGNGGSGVVIISYVGSPIATGGTITSSGGNTIHTFTSSGSFVVGTPPVTYATWNPADKNADLVLSNGNLTATVTSNQWDSVRSTIGKSSGKWYWEVTKDGGAVASVMLQGIALASANIMSGSSYCGLTSDSWGYWGQSGEKINNNSFQAYGATYATGDIIGIALDMDNGTIECFKNGVSQGTMYSGLTGEIFACGSCTDQSFSFTANFGASAFTYTPPVGFNAGLYE